MTEPMEFSAASGTACAVCGEKACDVWRRTGDRILGGTETFTAVRCRDCKTVRLQPRPNAETMNRHYAPGTYARSEGEAETSELGKRLDFFFARQADRAVQYHGRNAGKMLDVGCGDGRFMRAMQNYKWIVEGIETEPVSAGLARRRTSATVHETPLEQAPVARESFDMVSLLHVLEHVPDPQDTLRRAFAVLKPGGTLLLALPNVACLESALFGSSWYPLDLPRHYWGFHPSGLTRLLQSVGFENVRVKHFPFLFTPQSLRYKLRPSQPKGEVDAPTPPARSEAETSDRKTRAFMSLVKISETLGRVLPGEVMELAARKPAQTTEGRP